MLDPQEEREACSHAPSSHPVRGTGVGNMNTHGYSERIIKAGL